MTITANPQQLRICTVRPRSLLPGAFRRFRPYRHELRIIPAVKEDHAVQFLALQHGAAPSLGGVHLGVAVPGPFHGWLALPGCLATIHLALDVAEVKVAPAPVVELDVRLDLLIKKIV